jgi:hypothetical protein
MGVVDCRGAVVLAAGATTFLTNSPGLLVAIEAPPSYFHTPRALAFARDACLTKTIAKSENWL